VSSPPRVPVEEQIQALEERLLDRRVRASPSLLGELLADDFLEFGSSGRVWTRQEILAALRAEPAVRFTIRDFRVRRVARDAALATYRARAEPGSGGSPQASLRSSLWVWRVDRWQIVFHQGTPTMPD
jgi:hypothetical protein